MRRLGLTWGTGQRGWVSASYGLALGVAAGFPSLLLCKQPFCHMFLISTGPTPPGFPTNDELKALKTEPKQIYLPLLLSYIMVI